MNKLLTNSKKYVKGELKKPEKLQHCTKKSMVITYAEAVGESNVEIKMQACCKLVSKRRTKFQ